jgi:hypothetical protein
VTALPSSPASPASARRAWARPVAIGWAIATFTVAAATAPAQGIGRDEGVYLAAAESYAAWLPAALRAPRRALALADARFASNHEHPPLAKELYGLTHALFTDALGVAGHVQGARIGAFAFAALLSLALSLLAFEVDGLAGALIAPALFWAAPRHFYHAHPAALDLPIAALWLATVATYRQSLAAAEPRRRRAWGLATGALFGAAIAVKHNGWFLPPLLLAHFVATRWPALRRAEWADRARALPVAFPAMAVLGPVVLLASWPWLWHHTAARFSEYVAFHLQHENYSWHYLGRVMREPPFPVEYPFVVTALTVPGAVAFAMACGFAHGAWRLARAVRKGLRGRASIPSTAAAPGPGRAEAPPVPDASDELLLLLNALFPIALIAWPTVPHFGGVKHWLAAMPFLALLGARALHAAARTLAPRRAGALTAGLAALALAPALAAIAHVHPYGTAAYNELAGGAPGAAALGMQRQFWGDDVVGALDAVNAHARPGARVWWQETARSAVAAWQRDGRVRRDLAWVDGPEEADVSIWHYHQEFRDKEYRTWTAFGERPLRGDPPRSPAPVAGVYLDEVPLVQVYARDGSWR